MRKYFLRCVALLFIAFGSAFATPLNASGPGQTAIKNIHKLGFYHPQISCNVEWAKCSVMSEKITGDNAIVEIKMVRDDGDSKTQKFKMQKINGNWTYAVSESALAQYSESIVSELEESGEGEMPLFKLNILSESVNGNNATLKIQTKFDDGDKSTANVKMKIVDGDWQLDDVQIID